MIIPLLILIIRFMHTITEMMKSKNLIKQYMIKVIGMLRFLQTSMYN